MAPAITLAAETELSAANTGFMLICSALVIGLTTSLRTAVLADWRNQAPKRLPELRDLCAERAERQGGLRVLEPDLKEARGGLRDATALRAVAASWLADAPREGLADARRRLLDVRDALHLVTGRATDRLALQEQDQVAAELGLLDADALLRQVYEAARLISSAVDHLARGGPRAPLPVRTAAAARHDERRKTGRRALPRSPRASWSTAR
ncbi:Bifunctional uridylyltransferase/uridylyl-removing enzyme [Streptomyces violaceorubidus]